MFEALGDVTKDVAGAIAFLLPGFLAISAFEATSPSVARSHSVWQWTLSSLVVSLSLGAVLNGVYRMPDWPREATDPQFYGPLFGIALAGGFSLGRFSATDRARKLIKPLGLLQPRWIWYEVMHEKDRYVIVHLVDGTVLYGYPGKFTDDAREETKEIFLTDVYMLIDPAKDQGAWQKFQETEGVLVESPQIRYVQLVEAMKSNDS
jgi:hypothetical protein